MLKWVDNFFDFFERIDNFCIDLISFLEDRHKRMQERERYNRYIEGIKEFWATHCTGCGKPDPWVVITRPGKRIEIRCGWCGEIHYDS